MRASLLLALFLPGAGAQETQKPAPPAAPGAAAPAVDFVRDVQPIFKEHCVSCHGEKKQKGQLRLDSKSLAFRGGVSGAVLVPGKAAGSLLVKLLTETDEESRMPQKAPPLPKDKVELIRAWVDQGAAWPDAASVDARLESHWAYVKPVRPEPPAVKNAAWVRHPVDAFVAREHEARGLTPRPEAAPHVLLRRLYVDLIGLPPTRGEIDAFVKNPDPKAYEKVVDALLADPRYGERWGRHFMDVWRYSDWMGYGQELRESQRHVWRWRDWIVESLNQDKPYDRMIVEMLAGDELAPDDPNVVRATAFVARNWYKFSKTLWMENIVEHTSKAFLATTLNCAKCHHHFFDPISHQEYYQFRAFFEPHNVRTDAVPGESDTVKDGLARIFDAEPAAPTYLFVRGNEKNPDTSKPIPPGVPRVLGGKPLKIEPVPLPPGAVTPEKREFVRRDLLAASERDAAQARQKVDAALAAIAKLEAALAAEGKPAAEVEKSRQPLQAALEELPLTLMAVPVAEAKHASLDATIAVERVEDSGDKVSDLWKKAAEAAAAAQRKHQLLEAKRAHFLARRAVAKAPPDKAADPRKKLAEAEKALAKAEAEAQAPPATAYKPRKVNTYPSTSTGRRLALARWIADAENPLAARVAVNHVWMRHFGKPIVPTVFEFGKHGQPPSHPALLDWLATEFLREKWSFKKLHRLLVTSGAYRMDSHADPANLAADPENRFLWRMNPRRMEAEAVRDSVLYVTGGLDPTPGGPELDHAQGLAVPRRSVYFRHAQEKQMEFLTLFDAASVAECYQRTESVVPQQALALANSALVQERSRPLAARLSKEAPDAAAFVALAFTHVLARPPSDAERAECGKFLAEQAALLAEPAKLSAFTGGGAVKTGPSPDPAQRAREDLVQVLFNHNDFVTVR